MFIITVILIGVMYWLVDVHHDKKHNKAKDYYLPQQSPTNRQLPSSIQTEDAEIIKRK